MGKWIRRILMLVLLAVFLGSLGSVLAILHRYKVSQDFYEDAITQYVRPAEESDHSSLEDGSDMTGTSASGPGDDLHEEDHHVLEMAPFEVDFDALRKVGPDVVGWLYCPGTIINYPVVQGETDDDYLHTRYDGVYNFPGSIFVEADNKPEFQDYNTIIYGHNMLDNTMFAYLEDWEDQSFYDDHPVMWLLTPEQDYKILLFSGYTTSAYSDVYTIIPTAGEALNEYIAIAKNDSEFQADVELREDAHYVLLSTCAYSFTNARFVLHGMLEPLGSAGGVPLHSH